MPNIAIPNILENTRVALQENTQLNDKVYETVMHISWLRDVKHSCMINITSFPHVPALVQLLQILLHLSFEYWFKSLRCHVHDSHIWIWINVFFVCFFTTEQTSRLIWAWYFVRTTCWMALCITLLMFSADSSINDFWISLWY